ncbi:redoxin domain-containing protein [bacterium]|nr:redoxin domain-containing protein [bacterium]
MFWIRLIFTCSFFLHLHVNAEVLPSRAENFALIDHEGKSHELDYYLKMEAVKGLVVFVQGNGCPLVQKRLPELEEMKKSYQPKGILFCMLNANLQDSRAEIKEEINQYGSGIPVLKDEPQIVARSLGVQRTGEIYLISSAGRKIVYRGAIDDRLGYQAEKPMATKHYLRDAIENLLAGKEIKPAVTEAPGCKITFPKYPKGLTYTRDIAPILAQKCVTCHTKGGLGPFAMSSYRKIAGWSDMIAEVIMTRQMPPWQADPEIGDFSNDCSLSPEEANKVVTWVAEGSPKGEGPDPLVGLKVETPDWSIGKPDKVIKLPAQKVESKGVFDYRYVTLDNPFDRDVWLKATEVRPGNLRVLHHVVVRSHPVGKRKQTQWITTYAPGTQAQRYPEGSSVYLKKGHQLWFQLHYTASGKPEVDETQIGLHVSDKPTAKIFKTAVVLEKGFKIMPGDRASEYKSELPIPKDSTLYAINPHMHFRGKFMEFEAKFPDGSWEMLLSVPNYNFNWQRTYVFQKPRRLPRGTKIEIRNAWDNSVNNPNNPDPRKTVVWGQQSFDEMFFATLGYIED